MKNKLPYVEVYIPSNNKTEYWPYTEVQEYCLYEISKDSIIYLTKEELKELEESD